MNKTQRFGFFLIGVALMIPVTMDVIKTMRDARNENDDLDHETLADLYAARSILETTLKDGGYANRDTTPEEDAEFHKLVYRLKKD